MTLRKVKESPRYQGEDERIAYTLDTTPWGGYDSGAAVVIKDAADDDVSSVHLSGSASEAADVITTPLVIVLVENLKYKLEILWVKSGNTFEAYCEIIGEQ